MIHPLMLEAARRAVARRDGTPRNSTAPTAPSATVYPHPLLLSAAKRAVLERDLAAPSFRATARRLLLAAGLAEFRDASALRSSGWPKAITAQGKQFSADLDSAGVPQWKPVSSLPGAFSSGDVFAVPAAGALIALGDKGRFIPRSPYLFVPPGVWRALEPFLASRGRDSSALLALLSWDAKSGI